MTVVPILAGALLTVGSCYAAGRLVFQVAGLPNNHTGAIKFGTGAAILSALIFALCALQLVSVPSLVILGLGLLATAIPAGPSFRLRGVSARRLVWIIPFATFGVWYFVNALAPEVSADGTFYHLAFPARYLQHGGFYKVTTNFYAYLSQGLEMLYLMAFAIGKHSAAAITHLAFLIALAAGMIAYGTWIAKPAAGWLAALIVFTSPVIAMDATIAYNDVAVAAILFFLFFALMRWDCERTTNWLIVAGLLAGFAYAIKYTAAIATPYAVGFVLWRAKSIKPALLVGACAALLIAPWMIKNWLWVDNPVSPFFNRAFPNPYVSIEFEDGYRANLRHFNGAQLDWRIPFDATVSGNRVQGNLGPVFLFAPLALVGVRSTEVRRLLFAGTLFFLPWFANLGARFLIPCASFFAFALALTIAKWKWAIPVLAVTQIVLSWPQVVERYSVPGNWRLFAWPVAAALRQIPEKDFIIPAIDTYSIARMVDRNTPPGSVIYTALPLTEAYSERTYILNYAGALNQSLEEMRWTPFRTDLQPIVRLTFRPNSSAATRFRILQKGGCAGPWSISEIRWTPHRPAAITANPEPWYARWANDGNPSTRWKIWQPLKPGMYWEASFASAGALGTVEIDASPDQSNTCIELQTSDGTIVKSPKIEAIPLPSGIRREVVREFQNNRITHILIHKDEQSAEDFEANQAAWGIAKIAESGPARLYRLDTVLKTSSNTNVSVDLDAKTRNNHKE